MAEKSKTRVRFKVRGGKALKLIPVEELPATYPRRPRAKAKLPTLPKWEHAFLRAARDYPGVWVKVAKRYGEHSDMAGQLRLRYSNGSLEHLGIGRIEFASRKHSVFVRVFRTRGRPAPILNESLQ